MLIQELILLGVGIGAILWGGLAWSGRYRGWTDNPITKTSILAGVPLGIGLSLLAIFEMVSLRGRLLSYLVAACFLLAFVFVLITPDPLGPTWYRKLEKKRRLKGQLENCGNTQQANGHG